VVVVDASALAAVAFDEPMAAAVRDRLREHKLVAPAILEFELVNIARTKTRQRPAEGTALADSLRDALAYGVSIERVDHGAVLKIAVTTGLSAYDASYLWLARHRGVPLVTLDKKLAAHAERF
jgi:predicted nucleic acid-binding protein